MGCDATMSQNGFSKYAFVILIILLIGAATGWIGGL